MTTTKTRRQCAGCGLVMRIHSLGLCGACYSRRRRERQHEVARTSLVCVCASPIRESIPWFRDTYQCGTCGRPFASDLTRDGSRVSAQGG